MAQWFSDIGSRAGLCLKGRTNILKPRVVFGRKDVVELHFIESFPHSHQGNKMWKDGCSGRKLLVCNYGDMG